MISDAEFERETRAILADLFKTEDAQRIAAEVLARSKEFQHPDGKGILWGGLYVSPTLTIGYKELHENLERSGHPLKTLETSEGGKWFANEIATERKAENITAKEADKLWELASQCYCENLRGDVRAHVENPLPDRTFSKVELPTCLANGNIDSINGVSRNELLRGLTEAQRDVIKDLGEGTDIAKRSHVEKLRAFERVQEQPLQLERTVKETTRALDQRRDYELQQRQIQPPEPTHGR